MINGRCECGEVRFEVRGEILDFSHCHCSICRRLHGAAFASFAGVERSAFRFIAGETSITTYPSSARNDRVFCSKCGSAVLCDPKTEPGRLYLSMSAIEGNPPLPEAYHQYAASRAPWHDIDDELKRYDAAVPPG